MKRDGSRRNLRRGLQQRKKARYFFLWRWVVIGTSIVAFTPLVILTLLNYFQYQATIKTEVTQRVYRLTSLTKRTIAFFLDERRHALTFVASEHSPEALSDQGHLNSIFNNLYAVLGGMIDLGFINESGRQIAYVGPYDLIGKDYSGQDWFNEVILRGHYASDVFMGYRNFPHFVIAVARNGSDGRPFVLRATIDSEIVNQQLRSLNIEPPSEAFIINREGILQTPSIRFGNVLDPTPFAVPPYSDRTTVIERRDDQNNLSIVGYAYVPQTPFIIIVEKMPSAFMKTWFALKRNLWLFLFASMIVILLIVMGTSYYLVSRIRLADTRRAQVLQSVEHTNKMASIGRLAAGVAHEINNPLAIINEKAGLMKDISLRDGPYPQKERHLELLDAIAHSVDRCSRITRRLLRFAKHIDVQPETIELPHLLKDVLSFLGHEAEYRKIVIDWTVEDDPAPIVSDRGQLQQVFLNLINNSLNALSESGTEQGRIHVVVKPDGADHVDVVIEDNGPGIRREHLEHIFDPFFTTRSGGTGLGLSITYGIVEKLGGKITVESELDKGTQFTIILPIHFNSYRENEAWKK